MNAQNPMNVLVVEDNPADVWLAKYAFRSAPLANVLNVVGDGVEALSFLRREGAYAEAPRPDVVFLDLNLPRKGGFDVLAEMKVDEQLREIPVIVLSSSERDGDVSRCYQLYASCYLVKPMTPDAYLQLIHSAERFWGEVARLPTPPSAGEGDGPTARSTAPIAR